MDCVENNSVCYCCVWKGGKILYSYNNGNSNSNSGGEHEIEKLAALCLEMSPPPYHRWYFERMGKRTFGFYMYEGYVYFAIVNDSSSSVGVIRLLEKLRDEFNKRGGGTLQLQSYQGQGGSTKAPLLGKHDNKRNHVIISMREIEMEEEHRGIGDSNNHGASASHLHKKWCRQVKIVLAVDAAVCMVLFLIWLVICHGMECTR